MSSAAASEPVTDPAPTPPLLRRAAFALVLMLAMATGTFPAAAFGVLSAELIADFSLSRAQFGLLTTVFFGVGGLSSIAAGHIVDRVGARRVTVASFGIAAAALVAMAVAPGYVWLVLIAATAGLSLSTGNPTTNKAVSLHVPPGRRGLIMGVKQAGVPIGAFIAGAALAPAAERLGWRGALMAAAAVPAASMVATLVAVPRDPAHGQVTARATGALPSAVRAMAVYAFLMGAGVAAVNAYLPLFGVERLELTTTSAGRVAAAVGMVGVVSRIAWGWASERLPSYRGPLTVMGLGAVGAILLLLVAPGRGIAWLWAGGVLFGVTALTWNAVGMLALLSRVEPAEAGRASGVVLLGFYTGFVPSPVVFGWIVDTIAEASVAWTSAWALVLSVFLAAGLWARRAA